MKRIKTVMIKMRDVADLAEFDEKVNAAMAEGWTLTKREALQVQSVGVVCILYAELERELVEEKQSEPKERRCGNCAHYGTPCYDYPCTCCTDANKWEPKT